MVFIKKTNLKPILKARQINQKQKKIYLENRLIKHGSPLKKTHHTIEISIEAPNNEINEKHQNIQTFRKQNKKL